MIGVGKQGTGDMAGGLYAQGSYISEGSPFARSGGFLGESDVQVVAVCDVDTDHRNQARDIVNERYGNKDCAAYNDFRELLARDDIDAVLTAVPDHWHALIGVMAARAGKDVYGEKPLAYSIAEGRAICDAVKKYGVVWQTGSQQRSDATFRRACELVRNGRIGKVHTVRVSLYYAKTHRGETKPASVPDGFDYDMWLGPAPWAPYLTGRCHAKFRWINDYSGGMINDWANHHCDIGQWGMGTEYTAPVEIEGKGVWPRGNEDSLYDTVESYRFECRYAEGFTMIVSDERQFPRSKDGVPLIAGFDGQFMGTLFEGTEGWVHVNRGGMTVRPKSLLDTVIGPNEIHLYKSNNHYGNFIDCVKSRAQTIAPAEVSHHSIMIGHLGRIAMKMGRKLKWDPKEEHFINDPEADRLLSRSMRSPWHL